MTSNLSCLIVLGTSFPQQKLSELLAPDFCFSEFEDTSNLSEAFQILLNSNFNLCLIGSGYQEDLEAFFRDMSKLGRDKSCAFVKVVTVSKDHTKASSNFGAGFCAAITNELLDSDIAELRRALSREVVRIAEQQRGDDIPKYVELVLKEVDVNARKLQRGMKVTYDKVIKRLVKDMMCEESQHRDSFLEKLSVESEQYPSFESIAIEVPEAVVGRNLPKLGKTRYEGSSNRVWNKLLKRYGNKTEQ